MGNQDPVNFGGKTVDRRTAAMLKEAQRLANEDDPSIGKFRLTQGSWSHAAASKGTHDGPGAFDMYTSGYSGHQKDVIGMALREVGFASWKRTRIPGTWEEHWHGIAMGTKDLAPLAKSQVNSYRNGRDGLIGNHRDPDPRPKHIRTWEEYQATKKDDEPAAQPKADDDDPPTQSPAADPFDIEPGQTVLQTGDRDGDGLTDQFEQMSGSDPSNPDTDGDRLDDATEQARGTDPRLLDSDGDGLTDWLEYLYGPSPADPGVPAGAGSTPAGSALGAGGAAGGAGLGSSTVPATAGGDPSRFPEPDGGFDPPG